MTPACTQGGLWIHGVRVQLWRTWLTPGWVKLKFKPFYANIWHWLCTNFSCELPCCPSHPPRWFILAPLPPWTTLTFLFVLARLNISSGIVTAIKLSFSTAHKHRYGRSFEIKELVNLLKCSVWGNGGVCVWHDWGSNVAKTVRHLSCSVHISVSD